MYLANRIVQGLVTIVGLVALFWILSGRVLEGFVLFGVALIIGFFFWNKVN